MCTNLGDREHPWRLPDASADNSTALRLLIQPMRKPDVYLEIVDAPDQRSLTLNAPGPDRARHRAELGVSNGVAHGYVRRAGLAGLNWPLPERMDDKGWSCCFLGADGSLARHSGMCLAHYSGTMSPRGDEVSSGSDMVPFRLCEGGPGSRRRGLRRAMCAM